MAERPQNLSDLVVVIAGASSGFGRGAALKLGAEGAKVVVAARLASDDPSPHHRQPHPRRGL